VLITKQLCPDEISSGEFTEPTFNQGKEGRQSKKKNVMRQAQICLVDAIYNRIMEKLTDGKILQGVNP